MGAADFRVGGRIFAAFAHHKEGYGNLMLTPEQQAEFVRELPEVFLPIHGGWGKMGATHIRLASANRTCWLALCVRHGCSGEKRMAGQRRSVLRRAGGSEEWMPSRILAEAKARLGYIPMQAFAKNDPLTDAELDRLGDFLKTARAERR
jgi:hypothetical protein